MQKTIKAEITMGHGVKCIDKLTYKEYYRAVYRDFFALKKEYPYSDLCIPPTCEPELASIVVVAVNSYIINITGGSIEDFTGTYSRKLRVEIPMDYLWTGCEIYGGKWIEKNQIKSQYWHFNGSDDSEGNHKFCVGVPASFIKMDNVILECVRTADNMLTAYRKYITGRSKTLELISYSHGSKGEKEYEQFQRQQR